MADIKIGVMGAAGRMGRELVRAVTAQEGCTVVGGTEQPDSGMVGQDIGDLAGVGTLGIAITDDA